MRHHRSQLTLLALPFVAHAVKLSDMKPEAQGLPSKCDAVYRSEITGCLPKDFMSRTCSDDCLDALQTLEDDIEDACGDIRTTGSNLVIAFLSGSGPKEICSNAGSPSTGGSGNSPQTTAQEAESTKTTSQATTTDSSSRASETTSVTTSETERPVSTTEELTEMFTSTVEEARTTTSGLILDASSTPATSEAPTAESTSRDDEQQESWQDTSGGGSPFDTQGNLGAASTLSISAATILLSVLTGVLAILP